MGSSFSAKGNPPTATVLSEKPMPVFTLGVLALSFFFQRIASSPLESRDAPTVLTQYNNWAVDGCFVDSADCHALSFQLDNSSNMTVEKCVDTCSAAGYIRAGLVAATQCWCGNVIKPGSNTDTINSCSISCPGNSSEICGGQNPSRMLEYSIRPPVVPHLVESYGKWNGIDVGDAICIPDDPSARTLHHLQERSDTMTVEKCLDACLAQDFSLAGLEYGSECWCGNADLYGRHRLSPGANYCNYPCTGNPTETCGGSNALNIYDRDKSISVGPPSPFTFPYNHTWFFGSCIKDEQYQSGGQRILPHYPSAPIPAEDMTPFLCIDRCAADGYNIAGLEYGQECWCGSPGSPFPSSLSAPLGDCNMPCLDYADFSCGGPNRLLYYYKGQ